MKTLVLGASENPERYSNKALQMLKRANHECIAIGNRAGEAHGVPISKEIIHDTDVDTITLYLSPKNQVVYYDYILSLKPRRIIFNPGTENPELIEKAHAAGIKTEVACTLVLLSIGQY